MSILKPYVLRDGSKPQLAAMLSKRHDRFDESFLQELLAHQPELLPVQQLRPDAGQLLCIGREVGTGGSGTIDNLYLSTGGYVVVVETKLWRNPQSRREVVSQVLDYVKVTVHEDYEWLEDCWQKFQLNRSLPPRTLFEAIAELADDEMEESGFIDRVNRALAGGDVIALIVGDGIETRLQQLVAHLCRDSAHLRYSLGLAAMHCFDLPGHQGMLVLPELVQDVEPVQRAYVRVELDSDLAGTCRVRSVLPNTDDMNTSSGRKRITLTQEAFYESLATACSRQEVDRVRFFVDRMVQNGVEPDFKSASLMLKAPDPSGEADGASLLAIEQQGSIFNPRHAPRVMKRKWGWPEQQVEPIVQSYWHRLHEINPGFSSDGVSHLNRNAFLPLSPVIPKLDEIGDAILEVLRRIEAEADAG